MTPGSWSKLKTKNVLHRQEAAVEPVGVKYHLMFSFGLNSRTQDMTRQCALISGEGKREGDTVKVKGRGLGESSHDIFPSVPSVLGGPYRKNSVWVHCPAHSFAVSF